MKARPQTVAQLMFLAIAAIFLWSAAAAQDVAPNSLLSQLETDYKPVKLGTDSTGTTILEPGKVLVLQKGGILGVPLTSVAVCPSHYQDGNLKGPNGICKAMVNNVSRFLTAGEKVYILKVEVISKDEKVILSILECDSCNGVTSPSSLKSEVVFHYPKGYLESADPGQVEDLISQVLADDAASADQQPTAQAAQAPHPAQPPSTPMTAATPPTVQLSGESPDQVTAALGQPEKILNLGPKQIYVYKDLKVTFVNGKVTDAE